MSSDSETSDIATAIQILKRKRQEKNKKYHQKKLDNKKSLIESDSAIKTGKSDDYANNFNNKTQYDL